MAVYMIFTIIMVNDSNSLLRLTRIKVLIIVGPAPIAAVPFWVSLEISDGFQFFSELLLSSI